MFDVAPVPAQLGQVLAGLTARGSDATLVDWVSVVQGCQRVICAAHAAQTVALAHVAATEDVALPDGTVVEQHRGLGHRRLDAPALVSDQLGLTDAGASTRMDQAVHLVTEAPRWSAPWPRAGSTATAPAS